MPKRATRVTRDRTFIFRMTEADRTRLEDLRFWDGEDVPLAEVLRALMRREHATRTRAVKRGQLKVPPRRKS